VAAGHAPLVRHHFYGVKEVQHGVLRKSLPNHAMLGKVVTAIFDQTIH